MSSIGGVQHLILDRDGVLNQEAPALGYVRHPEELHWLPGSLAGLARLRTAGIRVSVATNQSGVGRGHMSNEDLDRVHARMRRDIEQAGGALEAIFVCTHSPAQSCECRKPAPRLIQQALAASAIGAQRTLVVGDSRRDLEAAWRCGVNAALVRTGKGQQTEAEIANLNVPVYDDLQALVEDILRDTTHPIETSMSIPEIFSEHHAVMQESAQSLTPTLERVIAATAQCLRRGNKILACGNGGSASDAQHFVAELVGRFREERRALAAICLAVDTATLTAVGNDYGYEQVFARQVQGLARPGDLLFAISTSGNSANVLRAAEAAHVAGCGVIAMTGASGGKLAELADQILRAPSGVVARIQEVHALCIHIIAQAMDEQTRSAVGAA